MNEPFKVRIIKCSNETLWYKDKVGKTYTVIDNPSLIEGATLVGQLYVIRDDAPDLASLYFIKKEDAEILNETEKKHSGYVKITEGLYKDKIGRIVPNALLRDSYEVDIPFTDGSVFVSKKNCVEHILPTTPSHFESAEGSVSAKNTDYDSNPFDIDSRIRPEQNREGDCRYVMELYTREDNFDRPYRRMFFDSYPKYRIEGTTVYLEEKQNDAYRFDWKRHSLQGTLKDLEEVFLGVIRIEIFKQFKNG